MPTSDVFVPVIEGTVRRGRGLLAVTGRLLVTADTLRFVPEGRLGRWLGAEVWQVPLTGVDGIATGEALGVEVAGTVHWFVGAAAERIGLRLESQLLWLRRQPCRFESDEAVVVHGDLRWEQEGGARGQGHGVLTRRTLWWWPSGGPVVGQPLSALRSVAVEASSGALILDNGEAELILQSSEAAELYGWLRICSGPSVQGVAPLGLLPATLHRAAVPIPAWLVLLRGGVEVIPRAGLGTVMPVHIRVADLLQVAGSGDSLSLTTASAETKLSFPSTSVRAGVVDRLHGVLGDWAAAGQAWGGEPLGTWLRRLARASMDPPEFSTPALGLRGDVQRAGTLALFEDELVFVPSEGAPVHLPIEGLVRSRGIDGGVLGFIGVPQRWRIPGGDAAVERFWQLCGAPARCLEGAAISNSVLHRLLGVSTYARALLVGVPPDDAVLAEVHPADLSLHGGALSLVVPGVRSGVPQGTPLHLELGRRDGVYTLFTEVFAALEGDGPRTWRLVLARPHRIEVFNKRQSYRAPTSADVSVCLHGQNNLHSGVLRDLSATGVGLWTDAPITPGQPLTLQWVLESSGRSIDLPARVVRRGRAVERPQDTLLGVRLELEGTDEGLQAAVVAEVMQLQLAMLGKRLSSDEIGGDP